MKKMLCFSCLLILYIIAPVQLRAQASDSTYHLSLNEAIRLARLQNKWIAVAQTEESASEADWRDARNGMLPQVGVNGSYQRFSKVTVFDGGLSGGHTVDRRPDQNTAAVGLDASVNVFAGGRQKAAIREQEIRRSLAATNTAEQTGNVSLQVINAYLEIVRLNEQDSLVGDQIKRAETRVKHIQALYDNQKVTRSDVLRAQLALSNQQLFRQQTENDIAIATARLGVLLALPIDTRIVPTDTVSGIKPTPASLTTLTQSAAANAYSIRRSRQSLQLQETRLKSIRANYYPGVQLFSAYGLNYPNFNVYPYAAQAYVVGFIGARVQYNISSLYHNRYKETAALKRISELKLQQEAISDNINQETTALQIKYSESLNRIKVAEASIEQATVNYKIVSAKYFNQLALLTDLLDADNLYQESRYNLIRSQTDALAYYYRLLYTSGEL